MGCIHTWDKRASTYSKSFVWTHCNFISVVMMGGIAVKVCLVLLFAKNHCCYREPLEKGPKITLPSGFISQIRRHLWGWWLTSGSFMWWGIHKSTAMVSGVMVLRDRVGMKTPRQKLRYFVLVFTVNWHVLEFCRFFRQFSSDLPGILYISW